MKRTLLLLSRLLAILSATVALMAVALLGHGVLTPHSRMPQRDAEGPSLPLRVGLGGLGVSFALGVTGYALARAHARTARARTRSAETRGSGG